MSSHARWLALSHCCPPHAHPSRAEVPCQVFERRFHAEPAQVRALHSRGPLNRPAGDVRGRRRRRAQQPGRGGSRRRSSRRKQQQQHAGNGTAHAHRQRSVSTPRARQHHCSSSEDPLWWQREVVGTCRWALHVGRHRASSAVPTGFRERHSCCISGACLSSCRCNATVLNPMERSVLLAAGAGGAAAVGLAGLLLLRALPDPNDDSDVSVSIRRARHAAQEQGIAIWLADNTVLA